MIFFISGAKLLSSAYLINFFHTFQFISTYANIDIIGTPQEYIYYKLFQEFWGKDN